ncbi:MAG: hypothetical protein EOP10_10195 [Proteobacteria bacterium]|nr:MAG: hypothetical protein EOP10_10195 [Pseudomonadota bacterium]
MQSLTYTAMMIGLSWSLISCVKESKTPPAQKSASVDLKPEIKTPPVIVKEKIKTKGPNAREICTRPDSIPKSPETIADILVLINAMPKPLSVPCLIDTLDNPFYVNATDNQFSGQPAYGYENPRIFLFLGSKLIVSVVPSGPGGKVVEFGYKTSETQTIKGELEFPVTEDLGMDAPYTYILNREKDGTVCGTCHFPESRAPDGFPDTAYTSLLVKPLNGYDVQLETLQNLNKECESSAGDHCPVIQSLFVRGNVQLKSFD